LCYTFGLNSSARCCVLLSSVFYSRPAFLCRCFAKLHRLLPQRRKFQSTGFRYERTPANRERLCNSSLPNQLGARVHELHECPPAGAWPALVFCSIQQRSFLRGWFFSRFRNRPNSWPDRIGMDRGLLFVGDESYFRQLRRGVAGTYSIIDAGTYQILTNLQNEIPISNQRSDIFRSGRCCMRCSRANGHSAEPRRRTCSKRYSRTIRTGRRCLREHQGIYDDCWNGCWPRMAHFRPPGRDLCRRPTPTVSLWTPPSKRADAP